MEEILCSGEILKIVGFLRSSDLGVRVAALDCVLELGYIGRRMLKIGLVEILMEASKSEAEFATVSAEILWGSSP